MNRKTLVKFYFIDTLIVIKPATVAEIPVIRTIANQTWPTAYNPIIGAQQVAYMLGLFYSPQALKDQMHEEGHRFIIGYEDDNPVAFASWSEIEPGIFKLHKLYVLPQLQGKGSGRQMLNYIIGELRQIQATSLRLNVNRHNTSAIAFYNKLGFITLKTEDIDIGGGYFMNDYVLSFDLQHA